MHAFSSKGGGGLKFSRGGPKFFSPAAAVTGPQRHLAALGLGDSIIAHAIFKGAQNHGNLPLFDEISTWGM